MFGRLGVLNAFPKGAPLLGVSPTERSACVHQRHVKHVPGNFIYNSQKLGRTKSPNSNYLSKMVVPVHPPTSSRQEVVALHPPQYLSLSVLF